MNTKSDSYFTRTQPDPAIEVAGCRCEASTQSLFAYLVSIAPGPTHPLIEVNSPVPEENERARRATHREVFDLWLALDLAAQKADLERYAAQAGCGVETVLDKWLCDDRRQLLVPQDAEDAERRLFCSDLAILFESARAARLKQASEVRRQLESDCRSSPLKPRSPGLPKLPSLSAAAGRPGPISGR